MASVTCCGVYSVIIGKTTDGKGTIYQCPKCQKVVTVGQDVKQKIPLNEG